MSTYAPSLLEKDLLAKGMTRAPKIMGVPFSFALINAALYSAIMLMTYAVTLHFWPIVIGLTGLVVTHIIMMMVSLQEEKALHLSVANALYCPIPSNNQLRHYTPFAHVIGNHAPYKEHASAKHIPWSHLYNSNTVMTRRGELMQVLTLNGIAFATEEDALIDANKQLRNRLLYQMASPHLTIYCYTIRQKKLAYPEGGYSNAYANGFNDRYRTRLKANPPYQNTLYIVLLAKLPVLQTSPVPFKKKKISPASHRELCRKLDEESLRLMQVFQKEQCQRLKADEQVVDLLGFLSRLVNLEEKRMLPPTQALASYLPYVSHHFAKRKGIVQVTYPNGCTRYAAMLSLKEYPKETHAALLNVVLSLDSELIMTQSFYFKHPERAKQQLEKQQRQMHQTDSSLLLADELDLAIEELKAGQAAYGEHHLSFCVMADTPDLLSKAIHQLDSRLNQEAGLITVREQKGVELAFWAQLPGNKPYIVRHALISSLNIAGLASLHNEPTGKALGNHWGEAITVLETLHQTAYFFNLHVDQVGNSLFIGPMGSGKTLLLSAILTLTTKYGGWRFVFDKDRSMEIVVRALGGSYNVLQGGKPSGMSPLQLPNTPENKAFNLLLLKKILETTGCLLVDDEAVIEKVIQGAYALEPACRTYRHIAPFFGVAKPGNLRTRFDRWHSTGEYAWLFDNEADRFIIDNKMSGYDIGQLLTPMYQEVAIPALMYLFHRLSECLDSSPTLVFIPEGWKALSDPLFQQQLKDWSKTPRKSNMALLMDTQSPDDLAASPAGRALTREARTQVFFANPQAQWQDYREFNLTEKEFSIIQQQLPAAKDHYFLLKHGQETVIAQLNLSGLDVDLAVLSANRASVLLLDWLRAQVGDAPEAWLGHFARLSQVLKTDYHQDFSRMLPDLPKRWETTP